MTLVTYNGSLHRLNKNSTPFTFEHYTYSQEFLSNIKGFVDVAT